MMARIRVRRFACASACSFALFAVILAQFQVGHSQEQSGILYPQDSETRSTKLLDGIWNFRVAPQSDPNLGFQENWQGQPLEKTGDVELMPVPSSFQDITQSRAIREHIGWIWYDREFFAPADWNRADRRIFLRFGSVNYESIVYVNGVQVTTHSGGHLPFQTQIQLTDLSFTGPNRLTVAINNTLTPTTVPQGFVTYPTDDRYPEGFFIMTDNFDFFKYAGIHRSVFLYSVPVDYINYITVKTNVAADGTTGIVDYDIVLSEDAQPSLVVSVELRDRDNELVGPATGSATGTLNVPNAKLWWPYTMVERDSDAGYLHTLVVYTRDLGGNLYDAYRLKVGIRAVQWNETSFTLNGQNVYFRGFGRHEDSHIRGRGLDPVLNVKDHNLLKWIGANSYRTSHYPYSEELMDLADRIGIIIIDEIAAVSLTIFSPELLETHKQQMTELIQRDKNRASVVMWSVANEPRSEVAASETYFRDIFAHTRTLDTTRPVMVVCDTNFANDKAAQWADIIGFNRYHNWYTEPGHVGLLDGAVERAVIKETMGWMNLYQRPLIFTEYGADTIAGMHLSPSFIFTEEFQMEYFREHFRAFDFLRKNSTMFIGEMVWNFADFMTKQDIRRVVGNKKGVFTRDRQPKAAAHLLRSRYIQLANEYSGYAIPDDLITADPVYVDPVAQQCQA